MKLSNVEEVDAFMATVDSCRGDVWLESQYGDRFNLKSKLSQYIAIAALLNDKQEILELFCSYKGDEAKFLQFFVEYPSVN